jgi:hypothetical protein
MPLPRGPRFPMFAGVRPPSTPKDPPVLGVGRRVVVTCRKNGSDRVTLTDENGTSALATVADGVEVEILAWRPRRGGDTRYRVVSTTGGVEGWLGAASLKPREPALAPKMATAAPSARLALPTRTPPGESQRTRRSRAVADGVAMKSIPSSSKSDAGGGIPGRLRVTKEVSWQQRGLGPVRTATPPSRTSKA